MAAKETNSYGRDWHASGMPETPARGQLKLELDVDVCVVGGGLAGLTVALETARRGWSVVVLEARRVAWNASGANTGFVRPGFAADVQALIDKAGHEQARTLWSYSEAGVEYVRRRAGEMPGVELEELGWLHVSKTGDGRLEAHAELLAREFGAVTEYWSAERVQARLRSPRYFDGIFFPHAFNINPLRYALGLASAAEAAGARIFEETPVLALDPAGVRKRITTPSARLRAGHVVLAGNVHIGGLMPDLADALVPVSNYVVVTAPLGQELHDAVGFGGSVSDTELVDGHYRVVPGDRLMWSGRCTVRERAPQVHARSIVADIARTYPQLRNVEAEFAWTGTSGNTVHRMPQIGELLPGVWLLSGFGAHGINTTAMGGELVARAIVEGNQTWRAFLPFELVWAGGRLGRAAVQTHYWYYRTREHIEGAMARRRRDAHIQAEARALAEAQAWSAEPELLPDADLPAEVSSGDAPAKPRKRQRRKAKPDVTAAEQSPAEQPSAQDPSPVQPPAEQPAAEQQTAEQSPDRGPT